MNSFDTVATMWTRLAGACLVNGNHRDDTIELVSTSTTLTNPASCLFNNQEREPALGYFGAELAWYLSGSAELKHLLKYAPSYEQFSDDGVTANGAYGARGLGLFELEALANRIREKPNSRQHVVPLWRAEDQGHTSKDVPCTVALHFLNCGGYLDLIVYMRSNDLFKGFVYDVPCFCTIQRIVAQWAGLALGYYHHHVGSLHIYTRDLDRVKAALLRPTTPLNLNIPEPETLVQIFEGEDTKPMFNYIKELTYAGH